MSGDSNIPGVARRVIHLSLERLLATDPIAFYELVMACRDRSHVLWRGTDAPLRDLSLIDGTDASGVPVINPTTREVVLELTEGDGPDMCLKAVTP